jgi:hypothetical protein
MADLDVLRGALAVGIPLPQACAYSDIPIMLAQNAHDRYQKCSDLSDLSQLTRQEFELGSVIAKGLADFQLSNLDTIVNSDQWRAKAWLLERIMPEKYGKEKVELSSAIAKVFTQLETKLPPEIYQTVVQALTEIEV